MNPNHIRSLTPHFPTYRIARHFLRVGDGVCHPLYRSMHGQIWGQRGSPQEQTNWTNPDEWIPQRLSGEEQALALKIWHESDHHLNPRYLRGARRLAAKHELLSVDSQDVMWITERGRQFIDEPDGAVAAEIDSHEGVLTILALVAERGPGPRGDFLTDFDSHCRTYTTYQSDTVIKHSLYDRLVNLIDGGLVARSGLTYEISDAGLAYLDSGKSSSGQSEVRRQARKLNREAREQLSEYLATMDPFKFEELIKFLLEEMGYIDVETTSPTHDKGVDVMANIELGISSVREVVQVKRHKGNVNRTVLDQLRGSLHRFNAVRGTIITTGGISKGTAQAAFEPGAAPITLIDGEKLLELLIQYEIGITNRSVEYIEFDASKLAQFESGDEEEPPG